MSCLIGDKLSASSGWSPGNLTEIGEAASARLAITSRRNSDTKFPYGVSISFTSWAKPPGSELLARENAQLEALGKAMIRGKEAQTLVSR